MEQSTTYNIYNIHFRFDSAGTSMLKVVKKHFFLHVIKDLCTLNIHVHTSMFITSSSFFVSLTRSCVSTVNLGTDTSVSALLNVYLKLTWGRSFYKKRAYNKHSYSKYCMLTKATLLCCKLRHIKQEHLVWCQHSSVKF